VQENDANIGNLEQLIAVTFSIFGIKKDYKIILYADNFFYFDK
jgi:hypothetical protein